MENILEGRIMMGQCKDCGAPALDGEEYCEACLLLHDLGLNDDTENHDDMFQDMDGLLPSDDPESNDDSFSGDLNIDEDIMSFLNSTEEEQQELTDEDIFALMDAPSSNEESQGVSDEDILSLIDTPSSEGELLGITDDDILSLLGESTSEDETDKDISEDKLDLQDNSLNSENSITDEDIVALDEELIEKNKNSDMGDILSDALGVLNDPAMDEMEKHIMDLMPEEEKQQVQQSKQKKQKKEKKEKAERTEQSLFKKLFANVPGPEPDPNAPTEEELEQQKKAEKEEKKNAKAAKKAEKKEVKEAKKKAAHDLKAEKKAEKKRLKAEEEAKIPVDTGRINKAGASIILVIAACFALSVLVGTNTFTYSNDVSSAKEYFNKKQYTKAYQQIAGLKIKAKDEETYEKIVTVMKVNKEYESYNNYYNMEMYPQSLDSLIKGLKRYEKCKEDASELNVTDDLNYVKSNIVHSLKDSFNLKENEVQYLMSMDSQDKYSEEIVKLAKAS